jgi:phosphonate transport system substrate-binding protein
MASAQIAIKGASSKIPLRSASPTINIEFNYSGDDPEGADTAADQFANLLSQETGLDIHATIQSCENFIVDNLGAGQVDLAPLSSIAYVLGHEKFGIEAELVNGVSGVYAYRGQINVQTSRGYTHIWDLQGKQFTSTSPESLTGFMLPYLLISETTGMTPTNFFGEVNFVGSNAQVIKDVYTGTTDSGSTYEDARASVASDYPDVFDVVSVLTYTEYMPQNPWAFRQGLDENQVLTLTNGIITVAGTPDGENALEKIFGFDLTGIKTIQDHDYDIVRDLIKVFGLRLKPCNPCYLPVVTR